MSSIEAVTVPRWGMTMTEGTLVRWLVAEGDSVDLGQELFELETEKIANVIEAPANGILRRIVVEAGDKAPVGALVGVIADAAATKEEIEAFIGSYASRLADAEEGQSRSAAPRTIAIGGASVNLLEMGADTQDAVVFLHGFGGDLSTWLFNQEPVSERIRAIAVDLPGHGASTPVAGDDVFSSITDTVQGAIEAAVPGKIHLVGHSFGGAVAAAISANLPARVASLTLIAPIGLSKQIDRSFLVDFIAAERRRQLQSVLERLLADPSKMSSEMVESTLRFKRLEGVPEALTRIADTIADESGQLQSIGGILGKLTCPVTVIWGDQDTIVPAPKTHEVPAAVELRLIRGAGHMPQMESSSAVNAAILDNVQRD